MLLTERQNFTYQSSSKKNTKLCKSLQNAFFRLWDQRERPEKISLKVTGAFCQVVVITSSYTKDEYQNHFYWS